MKLSRRAQQDTEIDDAEQVDDDAAVILTKGRPTPKRRDAQGRRGPVSAPKTRKEAAARRRQQTKEKRTSGAAVKPRSVAEQRAALKRGDESALPRRDQGPTRKLARNYVDSNRMLSNYMLWLFPLFIVTSFVPALRYFELVVILIFVVLVAEWFIVGRRLIRLATERLGKADGTPMTIGFYMGSRAYLPRRFRLPAPQVQRGDDF